MSESWEPQSLSVYAHVAIVALLSFFPSSSGYCISLVHGSVAFGIFLCIGLRVFVYRPGGFGRRIVDQRRGRIVYFILTSQVDFMWPLQWKFAGVGWTATRMKTREEAIRAKLS